MPKIRGSGAGPVGPSQSAPISKSDSSTKTSEAPKSKEAQPQQDAQKLSDQAKARRVLDKSISGMIKKAALQVPAAPQATAAVGTTKTMSARKAPPNTIIDAGTSRKVDGKYDGAFVGQNSKAWSSQTDWTKLDGIKPNNGKPVQGKCLYVNGMNTPMTSQAKSMQHIANSTGHEVIGIHNATHGFVRDLGECTKDKMNIGNNGSHKTLKDTVYDHVKTKPNEPLNIVAHSQGGIITSRALRSVRNKLRLEDGMTPQQAAQALRNVRVQTGGAAAVRYPGGPQYLHHVNTKDKVPQALAHTAVSATDSMKHGPVNRFTKGSDTHSMNATYATQLVPFENLTAAKQRLQ